MSHPLTAALYRLEDVIDELAYIASDPDDRYQRHKRALKAIHDAMELIHEARIQIVTGLADDIEAQRDAQGFSYDRPYVRDLPAL
jgi:hypothetical protein